MKIKQLAICFDHFLKLQIKSNYLNWKNTITVSVAQLRI